MNKVVVFDFDKTLTYKDTLFKYFVFCNKNNPLLLFKVTIYILYMMGTKFRWISNSQLKNIGIKLFLSSLSRDNVEIASRRFAKTIMFNKLYYNEYIKKYRFAYIISASFGDYLKYIFPNDHLITSEIEYKNNRPVGLLFNCYGKNKLLKLKHIGIKHIDILYTDSISDLPLVKISEKIKFVKNDNVIECNSVKDFLNIVERCRISAYRA